MGEAPALGPSEPFSRTRFYDALQEVVVCCASLFNESGHEASESGLNLPKDTASEWTEPGFECESG